MANRIPYFSQAVFVGPSPASGYHFISYTGELNDQYYNLGRNHNLLKQINRVQNISFSIEANREEVRQLGSRGSVERPAISPPQITLGFEYLLNGLANDARIGMNVNYGKFYYPYSGQPFYPNNWTIDLLSGFISRTFVQPAEDPYWPYPMRDNRNIFLVREREGLEVLKLGEHRFDKPDLTRGVEPEATGFQVLAFGNCYLDNYETSASVGSFPLARVNFSCENISFYTSGSGCFTPAIDTTTRKPLNNLHFNIPEMREEGGPAILHPGDILLDISPSGFSSLSGLGISFNNIFINSYNIQFDLKRDLLSSLGHKCYLDREVTFPIIANLKFGMTVGDTTSGHFLDILHQDSGYNITIKLRNPLKCSRFNVYVGTDPAIVDQAPRHAGPAFAEGDIGIRYDFRGAKFESISFDSSIGSNKQANLGFSIELNPDDLSRGLFVSGLLNIEKTEDYTIDENGEFLLDENNSPIIGNLIPLY